MTRATICVMTLMFVLPSHGSAQAVPSPGDRIDDGTVLTGALAAWSEETIQLSVDSSRVEGTIAISRSQIATLESQQGTRSKRNLVGKVGLVVGGALAWATLEDNETRSCGSGDGIGEAACKSAAIVDSFGHAVDNVFRVALGMVAGALVGSLVGSAIRTENWVMVPLIEVAPTIQGTSASEFGFGLHARVRLPW